MLDEGKKHAYLRVKTDGEQPDENATGRDDGGRDFVDAQLPFID